MSSTQEQIAWLERKVGSQAKSPLFARLAAMYLDENRPTDALRVCDSGLAHHPYYTTGHLIKAKTLIALNMPAEARRHFEFVVDFLPGNDAVRELLGFVAPAAEEPFTGQYVEPLQEEKPKKRFEDMFQSIPASAKAPDVEIPPAAPPAEPAAPTYEQSVAPDAFGVSPEIPGVDSFGGGTYAEPTGTEDSAGFGTPQAPPIPASADDPFGGISGFTPEAQADYQPTYVEPEIPTGTTLFGETPQAAPSETRDYAPAPPATDMPAPEPAPASSAPMPFDGPGLPAAPVVEDLYVPKRAPEPEESLNSMILFAGPMDGDTYEKFSLRMRAEMSGENTMTLEDYLSGAAMKTLGPSVRAEAAFKKDRIEEITERLQEVKKITPVIDYTQKGTVAVSEEDTPASTGFVTPTLAEIYAKQGWFDDAIKAYRTLAATKPQERERFEKRIVELEEMKRQASA